MEYPARISAFLTQGLLREAASLLDQQRDLSVADRVVKARLQSVIGDFGQAEKEARELLLNHHLTGEQKAACLEALARSVATHGEISEALRYQSEAIKIASRVSTSLEVEFRAQYCRLL